MNTFLKYWIHWNGPTRLIFRAKLRDMRLLSLQDLEPPKAVKVILQLHLGDARSPNQIQKIARDARSEALGRIGIHLTT
jgi:hypothetical protein